MRLAIAVGVLWTVLVGLVLLVTPSLMAAPPCAGVDAGPGCETLEAAGNQLVWVTQQRPIVMLSAGGYVAIAILGWALRKRP